NVSSSRTSMSASSESSLSMALIAAAERERTVKCVDMSLSLRHDRAGPSYPSLLMLGDSHDVDVGVPSKSTRLLCVHFLDGAGLEIDLDALDLVEIGPGHADEARLVRIVNRVNGPILIDAGFAGRKPVLLDWLELGVLGVGPVVLAFPLDHVRVFGGLA